MAINWSSWMKYLQGWVWNPDQGEQTPGPRGYGSESGTTVDETRAMQVAAVYRCISLIAQTAASLPLKVYRLEADGDRKEDPRHWLQKLLDEPNSGMTGEELRQALHGATAGWGNGYARIVRLASGRPAELWPMKPDRLKVIRNKDWALDYEYTTQPGLMEKFTQEKVLHVRGFSLDGTMGLSPLGLARESLGLAVSAERYAASFFASGGRPSGVLNSDKLLTPDQRAQIRQEFGGLADPAQAAGKKLWVLEAALKYQPISVSPEDMQMLQTRAFSIADIARFFGVPLHLLMVAENTPNWGLETQNLSFLIYTLRPYLQRLEGCINRWLIPDAERGRVFVAHDVDSLLQADSAARATFYSTMVQNGLMSRNEVRRREHLPNVPEGDTLTAGVNQAPVRTLGQAQRPAPATPGAPGDPPVPNVQRAQLVAIDDAFAPIRDTLVEVAESVAKLNCAMDTQLRQANRRKVTTTTPVRSQDGRVVLVKTHEEFTDDGNPAA